MHAAVLLAELPAAVAATVLYAAGGYRAGRLGERGRLPGGGRAGRPATGAARTGDVPADEPGYLATLRAGVAEAAARPGVPAALLAAALVGGFDAIEEYFPLITEGLGVPTVAVPLAMLPIGLAGAPRGRARWPGEPAAGGGAGRAPGRGHAAARAGRRGSGTRPALAASRAVLRRLPATLVVVDARLQERIESRSRATVTSVGGLGVEVATFAVYAAWALGELTAVAAVGLVFAAGLPWLLRAVADRAGSVEERLAALREQRSAFAAGVTIT